MGCARLFRSAFLLCRIFVIVGLPIAPSALKAQSSDLLGVRQGILNLGTNQSRFIVHITAPADGKLAGVADLPGLGITNTSLQGFAIEGPVVRFESPDLHGYYEGVVGANRFQLSGNWRSGSSVLPIVFTKVLATPREFFTPDEFNANRAAGEALSGLWHGKGQGSSSPQTNFLVIRIWRRSDGGAIGLLDYPEQALRNQELKRVFLVGREIRFNVSGTNSFFFGVFDDASDSIQGTFKSDAKETSMQLKKAPPPRR